LARNGDVTLIHDTITRPFCATPTVAPPTISKAFGAAHVDVGGTTTLTFTVTNPNSTALTGVSFADTLPAGLVVTTPATTSTCGGTVTTTTGNIALSGGTLAPGASCTFSVNVTGTTDGTKVNTSGPVNSTQSGQGGTASASIAVGATTVAPPTISKAFAPVTIPVGGTTTLTFTVANPNSTALTGVSFADTLPAGLVVNPASVTNSCGGAVTTTTGSIALAGGTLAAGATCTVSVSVTDDGTSSGTKVNTSGPVNSTQSGAGGTASASVAVAPALPPTFSKAFAARTIPVGGTTRLTFTLINPNRTALAGVSFADTLPAGLVANPASVTNSCGGTVATTTGSIALAGGTLTALGSCTVSVDVIGTTGGTKINTSGAVNSNQSGPGGTTAASVTVAAAAAPTISKAFGAATIPVGGTTTLAFTLTNPNPNTSPPLTGVSFADTLPAGLVVATPNGLTGSCGGGTITARAGGNSIVLFGATLAAGASCTFSINVTGTTSGTKDNTTVEATSAQSGPGSNASAHITVAAAPGGTGGTGGTGSAGGSLPITGGAGGTGSAGGSLPITGGRGSTYGAIALTMIGLGAALLAISHRVVRRRRFTA
jgi:uncharacterized repeat protein (TIGR01451 family)